MKWSQLPPGPRQYVLRVLEERRDSEARSARSLIEPRERLALSACFQAAIDVLEQGDDNADE